jgi:hypothetical protein
LLPPYWRISDLRVLTIPGTSLRGLPSISAAVVLYG